MIPKFINTPAVWQSLREAILTMLAILATFGCVLAIDAETGPAVLAVVLTMSLSRSQLDRDWRGRLEAALVLPLVGFVALGVGMLLLKLPVIGATVFVIGMAASIWLRRFGPDAQRIGSLIALPLVALLVTPYLPTRKLAPVLAMLMPMIVALMALAWVSVFHWLGRRLQWLPPAPANHKLPTTPTAAPREGSLRPVASTRMALQMAVALAVGFGVGFVYFPERWAWVVITAFIVNSGNRGRGDVAYKSVLRVVGAAAGTLGALILPTHFGGGTATTVALTLVAVFFGLWLRPLGYAWWALFVTLALALLQRYTGAQIQLYLWPRMEEIVIGALIGVAAAWFVLPVRSLAVLRLRLANALADLSAALDPETPVRTPDDFIAAIVRVEQLAPTFRAWRLLSRRFVAMQPADWIDALNACAQPAIAIIESRQVPKGLRTEVGKARRAMREPAEILPALQAVHRALAARETA